MFFVKEAINGAVDIQIEITEENVYCHCPRCGEEVQVDLNEFIGDKDFDLYGTVLYCEDCSRKVRCEK